MWASTQKLSLCIRTATSLISLGCSKKLTICTLPTELICEIFIHLDTQGLYSVKLTCKLFYEATKSRQFWQQVLCSTGPCRHNFSKKLSSCTLQEVEHQATQRLNIYERWVLDMPLDLRLRVFEYSTKARIIESELLPGGRWLLTSNYDNQYILYDLHMPLPQPHELANPGRCDHQDMNIDELFSFRIWIDSSKEHLCFRFVVWNRPGQSEQGDVTRVFIYETNIFEDGGKIACTTKTLYSRRSYFLCYKPSLALSEKYLIEVRTIGWKYKKNERWRLALIEYNTNDLGQAEIIPRVGRKDTIRDVFIITNDIMVATGFEFISLYSIQDLKIHHKQLVLPRQRIKMNFHTICRPFHDRGFDWMVNLYKYEFSLIQLPLDLNSPPRIVTLGRNPAEPGHGWLPGLVREDAALAMYGDWTAKIITYSWDVEMTHCVFQMKDIRIPEVASFPIELSNIGLDMTGGRLVFIDRRNCIVLDTALPVGPINSLNGL